MIRVSSPARRGMNWPDSGRKISSSRHSPPQGPNYCPPNRGYTKPSTRDLRLSQYLSPISDKMASGYAVVSASIRTTTHSSLPSSCDTTGPVNGFHYYISRASQYLRLWRRSGTSLGHLAPSCHLKLDRSTSSRFSYNIKADTEHLLNNGSVQSFNSG